MKYQEMLRSVPAVINKQPPERISKCENIWWWALFIPNATLWIVEACFILAAEKEKQQTPEGELKPDALIAFWVTSILVGFFQAVSGW